MLVEDDAEDIFLTKDALEKSKLSITLDIVRNGEDAMQYLHKEGPFAKTVMPDLIILDLNLPKKNGWDVLKEVRNDKRLKSLPITILTTSNQDPDIQCAYDMGANSYVTKPVSITEFHRVVHTIEDFWFTIVKLPPH